MHQGNPEDPAVRRPRTFRDRYKGWPLRVTIAVAAFFVFALIVTWLDQHVYWFHMFF
ncbi:hypothetical protein [Nonomuraea wenchangensis]|uniref:hypothetical protein n=1 Tax=Nonomuraea wenchangensis TaxID=568860 RepID=UPI00331ABA9E